MIENAFCEFVHSAKSKPQIRSQDGTVAAFSPQFYEDALCTVTVTHSESPFLYIMHQFKLSYKVFQLED